MGKNHDLDSPRHSYATTSQLSGRYASSGDRYATPVNFEEPDAGLVSRVRRYQRWPCRHHDLHRQSASVAGPPMHQDSAELVSQRAVRLRRIKARTDPDARKALAHADAAATGRNDAGAFLNGRGTAPAVTR